MKVTKIHPGTNLRVTDRKSHFLKMSGITTFMYSKGDAMCLYQGETDDQLRDMGV